MAGQTNDARSRCQLLYEGAVAQGNAQARLLVSPSLSRGASANLAWSIETKDDADLSTALR